MVHLEVGAWFAQDSLKGNTCEETPWVLMPSLQGTM